MVKCFTLADCISKLLAPCSSGTPALSYCLDPSSSVQACWHHSECRARSI